MQLIPKYWTLTVAYGCVTFMAGLKTSQSFVGRPLGKKSRAKHASVAFIGPTEPRDRLSSSNVPSCPSARVDWAGYVSSDFTRFHRWCFFWFYSFFLRTLDLECQECALSLPYASVGGVCSVRWWVRNVWILERKGLSERAVTGSWRHLLRCCVAVGGNFPEERAVEEFSRPVWAWRQSSLEFDVCISRPRASFALSSRKCFATGQFWLSRWRSDICIVSRSVRMRRVAFCCRTSLGEEIEVGGGA